MDAVRLPAPSAFLATMRDMVRGRLSDGAAVRALTGPLTVGAIALMVLNDHVLKGAGIVPGVLTGKLSDFAFLFFAPIVLVYLTRARAALFVAGMFAAPAALFATINVSPAASDAFARALSMIVPSSHVCDVEDLAALAILPLSWAYLWRRTAVRAVDRGSGPRWRHVVVTMIASIGCLATSAPPPDVAPMQPTHRAVYMSWKELRTTAVQVTEPRPVGKRGKLLIAGDHLFLSEPGVGVHVFDNADPKSPRALMFIQIPGNIDVAVRDGRLYADSFVDLLVFELDLPNRTAKLVERLEGQFEYDPYQTLASETPVHVEGLDRQRGVVIRLEPIKTPAEVAQ
jgi:hypothetical protein